MPCFSRTLLGICTLAAALGLSAHDRVGAQQPIPNAEGERVLEAKDLKGDDKNTFNKMRDGNIEVDKENRPILEKAAQWYVYRLTWPQYQRKPLPEMSDRTTLSDLVRDCLRNIPDRAKMNPRGETRERQLGYIKYYGREITKAVDEVLKNPLPIARVNAARILGYLGKVGPEEAGDAMVAVLEDKEQIDAVKLYALRGLKDLFETVHETTGKFKDPKREAKYVNSLTAFLHREMKLSKKASPEEIEAFRYLRREAVRALAEVHTPAVVVRKKVLATPALELLRVMSKDGFNPEPSSSERMEAALGVLAIESKLYRPYQADLAAQHVGLYLLDLANDYNNDRKNQPNMRAQPWKVVAVRFKLALDRFGADQKGNKNVESMLKRARPILDNIEKDTIPTSAPLLRRFLVNYKTKSKTVYDGDEKATVTLPADQAP